jgi:hypothetical protein
MKAHEFHNTRKIWLVIEAKSQNWCGNPTLSYILYNKEIEASGKSLPDD